MEKRKYKYFWQRWTKDEIRLKDNESKKLAHIKFYLSISPVDKYTIFWDVGNYLNTHFWDISLNETKIL